MSSPSPNRSAGNTSSQSKPNYANSVTINIEPTPESSKARSSPYYKNNSIKKVRLQDTRSPRIRSKSANYTSHLEVDPDPLAVDPSILHSILSSSHQSDTFPTKHYPNQEALRMSEERLLAQLQDPQGSDDQLDFDYALGRRNSQNFPDPNGSTEQYDNVDSQDELEKAEAGDLFVDDPGPLPAKIYYPGRIPSPVPGRPAQLNVGNGGGCGKPPFGKTGSFTSSSLWMSMSNEEDYLRHECVEKCSSTLHLAVKSGNVDEIEILLETGSDPNGRDCMARTPLHWAVCAGCNCDSCTAMAARCTQLLVDSPKTNIDLQDNNGLTALHLAAENQATKCASILLYSGADHSIKSKSGVKALALMVEKIPEAMDSLLSRAVSVEKYDPTNVKCELKLDFGAIVGYSVGLSQRGGGGLGLKGQPSSDSSGNWNPKVRKEMQLLTLILDSSSSARKKILTHPLIGIFLHLKWMKIKKMFWATFLLHVLLLLLYTMYILDVYLISCPYRPKITEPAAVKAAKAEGNYLQSDNSTYRAEFIKFSWFEFSPQLQELGTIKSNLYEGCPLEIGPTVKSVLLLALTILMVINEIFKMLPAPRAYWKRTPNRMQWALFFFIFITSWPVFMSHPNINFWQYQAAAFGLFLAWGLMLTQIGKFPILGLYVEILTKVLKNFGFFMITYASLLMAFALAFCVLFPGNAPYSSIPLAILKVLMMMVGEVNYEDLFYGNEENPVDDLLYPITGHILYGAFVIMITIVLMNLLVGLTVSDIQRRQFCIQGLQKDAELTRLSRQIGEIAQLESFVFSKRVQSFLPARIAAFLRDSILVVPAQKYSDTPKSPKPSREENWFFHCLPNDPNDKSIPENLKLAIIKLAASRHRNRRTNKCSKRLDRAGSLEAATPLLEEYQKYVTAMAAAHAATVTMAPCTGTGVGTGNSIAPGGGGGGFIWHPPPAFLRPHVHPPTGSGGGENTSPNGIQATGSGTCPISLNLRRVEGSAGMGGIAVGGMPPPLNMNIRDANELMKRLEEKIMDRMKIQMDTLYQKIEDRMMQ